MGLLGTAITGSLFGLSETFTFAVCLVRSAIKLFYYYQAKPEKTQLTTAHYSYTLRSGQWKYRSH